VYEQTRDVDVLLEFLRAENRAYARGVAAPRQASCVSQEMVREGNRVYVHVPSALCQRRASYLKSLYEGVLEGPVEVSIQQPAWGGCGTCRIALQLPL
jgi:hypothetical protein